MLHIAICDDEESFVRELEEQLTRYAGECSQEIRVTVFYDGSELVNGYDPSIDLVFLDIQMNRMDGLAAAERIRQMDGEVGIIFLTTLTRYALEGYKYQATNYIIKPMKYARLKAEMDRWMQRRPAKESPSLVVVNDSGRYRVLLKELKYVETFNRNLLLHTEKENILCYRSMKEMERELAGGGFVRCHTSYIVNLSYVTGVKKLEIELLDGAQLPISQPKRKEFMEKLTEYWGDQL